MEEKRLAASFPFPTQTVSLRHEFASGLTLKNARFSDPSLRKRAVLGVPQEGSPSSLLLHTPSDPGSFSTSPPNGFLTAAPVAPSTRRLRLALNRSSLAFGMANAEIDFVAAGDNSDEGNEFVCPNPIVRKFRLEVVAAPIVGSTGTERPGDDMLEASSCSDRFEIEDLRAPSTVVGDAKSECFIVGVVPMPGRLPEGLRMLTKPPPPTVALSPRNDIPEAMDVFVGLFCPAAPGDRRLSREQALFSRPGLERPDGVVPVASLNPARLSIVS